jgi:putative transposase
VSNTYTALHYHLVFSTKHRERWLTPEVEKRVWSYLGGIAREHKAVPVRIGGFDDHVHLLLGLSPTVAISSLMQRVKGRSSVWMGETLPGFRGFAWQDGYAAFTVSQSGVAAVSDYIQSQRAHHQGRSFEEEWRELLEQHLIAYEERYLFD